MQILRGLTIVADKDTVIETLKKNRETHAAIVKEAREGYVEKAKKVIEKRLAKLKEGQVVSLSFHLTVPQDHTNVYDSAIAMLEMHAEDDIELDSMLSQCLLQDDWDWKDHFLMSNAGYSRLAASMTDREKLGDLAEEFIGTASSTETLG